MSDDRGESPENGLDDDDLEDLLRAGFTDDPAESPLRERRAILDEERYRDFELIGIGGMGIVYRALDTQMNRPVAVKVIRTPAPLEGETKATPTPFGVRPPAEDAAGAKAYAELTDRFLQEAWLTGALEHPGIVPVHEVGTTPHGVPYYTMRYVKRVRTMETALGEAKSLDERMEILGPFLHVCDAIRYAQSRGVIHRDLKPANLGIGEFGEVFVLDWGLAKMRNEPDVADSVWQERIRDFRDSRDMKTAATVLGTPGYMSPEAARGDLHLVDERSDVYSLGSVLYRILTGRLPYEFESYSELLHRMREGPPAPASSVEPCVSVELSEICAKALSFEKADRYPGAGQLADAVREHRRESGVRSEVRRLLQEAGAAFDAAEALEGDRRLLHLDKIRALCQRVLDLRQNHSRARRLLAETDRLRKRTAEEREDALKEEAERARLASVERERARNRRLLGRVAAAALILLAIGTATAAWIFDGQRREAETAEREKTEILRRFGVTEQDRKRILTQVDDLIASREDDRSALERARAAVSSREKEIEEIRTKLTRAGDDRDEALKQLSELEAAIGRSNEESDAKGAEITTLKRRVGELEGALEAGTGGGEELARRIRELTAKLEEKKTGITELTEKLEAATAELAARDAAEAATEPGPITEQEKWIQGTIEDIRALEEKPGDAAVASLVRFARSKPGPNSPSEFRIAAVEALGRRADDASVKGLLDLLQHWEGEGGAQIRIITALAETGDPRAVDAIAGLLRRGFGTPYVWTRPFLTAALGGLGRIRTRRSLGELLDLNERAAEAPNRQTMHIWILRALTDLTGLPFERAETWTEWRAHAEETWKPTPLGLPEEGIEFSSEGWRFGLERPDEARWEFDRPEGAIVRVALRDAPEPVDAAWLEVRACAATEAFPRGSDESTKAWEKRCIEAAVDLARLTIPEDLRAADGAASMEPAALGGERAVRLSAEDAEHGGWTIHVLERHHLIYTVTLHHGPAVADEIRKELERSRSRFHLIDRR